MSPVADQRPIAVIDIGSNSIKSLVAIRDASGNVLRLHNDTVEARISAGISRARPRLTAEGMDRGVEAIRQLLAGSLHFGPGKIVLVATSAVRDAENGAEFRAQVRAATGHAIRILTGDEEANLIGRGLAADPALHGLRNFYVFDLGGGSLECLAFRERKIEQAVSLQLGCVRLTEKFVDDPTGPLPATSRETIARHTRAELARSGFRFSLPAGAVAVGTGGTVTTARAMLGARGGKSIEQTGASVGVEQLRELLDAIGALALGPRAQIPGLPAARADVMPAALTTLIAIADDGRFDRYENSFYNLRYGLADEALPPFSPPVTRSSSPR